MLSFTETLKQIIASVEATGGAIVERSTPSPEMLQRLRAYSIQQIATRKVSKHTLLEWFAEGFFDEQVRVCFIHLCKLGMTDDEVIYRFLVKVIDLSLSERGHRSHQEKDFEESMADALYEIWSNAGDEQTISYTFAQTRWLIAWDYQNHKWRATSLGRLLLELSPVQSCTFLLSVDSLFSMGENDFRHISPEVLRGIISTQPGEESDFHLMPFHRDILARLGLLRDPYRYYSDKVELTSIAKTVIKRVISRDNPFRDTAKSLLETEEQGETFSSSSSETEEILRIIRQSDLVDADNRNSITTSIQLFRAGKYLDSLRVVYPSIEAIVNEMIIRLNGQPAQFRGLDPKVKFLEQQHAIPSDVSSAVEVFTGRNRVLHGNFAAPADYVFPLCLMAIRYLRRLITEYKPLSTNVS